MRRCTVAGSCHFYPRSPCGERLAPSSMYTRRKRFLSTLSLRRATQWHIAQSRNDSHFYPRSPCGERPLKATKNISFHNFYPRSPCGERQRLRLIPIILQSSYFYPRSPCGERLRAGGRSVSPQLFLSTLSLRRATNPLATVHTWKKVFLSTLSLRRATF